MKIPLVYTTIKRLLVILALFLSIDASGQQPIFKNYSIDNGLLSNEVYHVIQDQKGYIWIATGQGVNRYNGYSFKNYNQLDGLPDNTVLELFEDQKGRIWTVTLTGELAWIKNDTIKIYPYNDIVFKHNTEKRHPIKKSFYVDSLDNVYISFYDNNPIKIDASGSVAMLKSPEPNTSIIETITNDKIIFGCIKTPTSLVLKNPVIDNKSHNLTLRKGFRSVSCRYKRNILYSDLNRLYYFDTSGKLNSHNFEKQILWISEDRKGLLWISFLDNGVKAYNNFNFSESVYHFLPEYDISSVALDHEDGYWFTTLKNGIFYTPSLQLKKLTPGKNGVSENIDNILSFDEKVWFSGGSGKYFTYDFNKLETVNYGKPKNFGHSKMLKAFGDSIILSELNKGTFLIYKNQFKKISERYFSDAIRLKDNNIHLFYRRKSKKINTPYYTITEYTNFYEIYTVQLYKDNEVWLGTDRGLFRLNLKTKEIKEINSSKLLRNRINVILKDSKNKLWIGTQGSGLIKYGDTIEAHYKKEDGLSGNSINAIKLINDTLWVGTNHGITSAALINDSIQKTRITNITKGHGLPANEIHDIAFLNNSVFAATNKGVGFFPRNIHSYSSPLYITNFKISGKDTVLLKNYQLQHDQNYIEISFVSINYQRNKPIEYYFLMEGIDKNWRKTTDLKIQYPSLEPGSYNLRIKAVNSFGKTNSDEAQISITIKKPYYQTYWFYTITILLILLIIFTVFHIIFKFRLNEIDKRISLEKELNKSRQQALSTQMNPHFIYNSLTSVQNYILNNNALKSSEYLSKLGGLMRRMLDNSQHTYITLQEEVEALQHYVDMELLRFHHDFNFELDIDKQLNLHEIYVPPLFLQPYVENAIHHGLRLKKGSKQLKVNIFNSNEQVNIHIEDNGVGRRKSKEIQENLRSIHRSQGMQITKKRLKLFNKLYKSEFKVSAFDVNPVNQDTGTRIEIVFSPF